MASLGTLSVILSAKADAFNKAMHRSASVVSRFGTAMKATTTDAFNKAMHRSESALVPLNKAMHRSTSVVSDVARGFGIVTKAAARLAAVLSRLKPLLVPLGKAMRRFRTAMKTGTIDLFNKALRRSVSIVGRFATAVKSALLKTAKWMAILGPLAAAGAMVLFTKKAMDTIDTTAELAAAMGTTTEKIIGLRHAAEMAGVGASAMDMSLQRMVRRLGEARTGVGGMARAVKSLRLDVNKLVGMDPSDVFLEIADKLQRLPNTAQKAALAFQVFGRSGQRLVALLQKGNVTIREQVAEAERLGMAYSRIDARMVEEANDAIVRMKGVFQGLWNTLAIKISPIITELITLFTDWAKSGEGMGARWEWLVDIFIEGLKVFLDWMAETVNSVITLGSTFLRVGKILGEVFGAISHDILEASWAIDDLLESAESFREALLDIGKPSKWIADVYERAADRAAKLRQELDDLAANKSAMQRAFDDAEAFMDAMDVMDAYTVKLQKAIDTAGMTAEQSQLWVLEQEGAKLAQRYQGQYNRALEETIKLQKVLVKKQQQEKQFKFLEKQLESLMTPLEKYKDFREKVGELFSVGLLDEGEFHEILRRQWKDLGLGPKETPDAGEFQTVRTSLVDVSALSIGARDPVVDAVDQSNEYLKDISLAIEEMLEETYRRQPLY